MKRILISALLAVTSSVTFAAASGSGGTFDSVTAATNNLICDGSKAGGGKGTVWKGSGYVLTDTEKATAVFSRAGFDIQCSANSNVVFNEDSSNLAAVGAGSAKGNQTFAGHTNGGAIVAAKKCTGTNDACGSTDVNTAVGDAITKGKGG